jgi:hypothetical protein
MIEDDLTRLRDLLDSLADVDPDALDDAALHDAAIQVHRLQHHLAVTARALRRRPRLTPATARPERDERPALPRRTVLIAWPDPARGSLRAGGKSGADSSVATERAGVERDDG